MGLELLDILDLLGFFRSGEIHACVEGRLCGEEIQEEEHGFVDD